MLRASSIILLAALALGVCACPPPPNPPTGTGAAPTTSAAPGPAWKTKSFSRNTEGCTQIWACDCSALGAKAGCHLEGSRDDSTTGVCAADSGPPTGCTRCMALPPPAACACKEVCP